MPLDWSHGLLPLAAALLAAGALTGFLAGVFGVGGGAVIVPVLYEALRLLGVPDDVRMPLTVGTSLAVIIPTALASYRTHAGAGAIDRDVLRLWAIPCALGVIGGASLATIAPSALFKTVFAAVAGCNGLVLLFGDASKNPTARIPGRNVMRAIGAAIGVLSALMGISGGMLSNLALIGFGLGPHRAIATSAGLGVVISLAGTAGYIAAGLARTGALPPWSLGYVWLPALVSLGLLGALTAPLGARVAHSLSRPALQRAFGIYLLLASARFIVDLVA